jgi:hypothetical protein
MNTKRVFLVAALVASLALAGCGGGSGGTGSNGSSRTSPTSPAGSSSTAATCDEWSNSNATSITPCVTISGLASGDSITVTDSYVYPAGAGTNGSGTLTETASGTYNFKAVNADTVNGGYAPGQWPIISFTVSGSAQCTNVTPSSSYHAQIACGTYPAVTPQVPTVQTMPGVSTPSVVGTPDIVPVVFNSSGASWTTGNQTNDVTFLQQFTASKIWGLLGQYGIGAASVESAVSVTNLTSAQTGSLLTPSGMAAYVQQNASTWDPGITGSTVFMIYLPPNQYYSRPIGVGYTGQVTVNSTTVTYAVVPDSGPVNGSYISSAQVYQSAESGLVDAITDPTGSDGYAWMSANQDVWLGLSAAGGLVGGENTIGIGTLCGEAGPLAYSEITVAQILPLWSNADAASGRNPCQPQMSLQNFDEGSVMLSDPSSVYAGVVQQTPAPVQATSKIGGISRTDQVVTIQPGQSVNVTFTFFTTHVVSGTNASTPGIPASAAVVGYVDSSSGAQQIANDDLNSNPSTPALLTVSTVKNLTRSGADGYVLNGDTLQVTVTASNTAFSGMYVLAINVPCQYVQGPDGPNETCSSPTDYTSLPVAITEGSTWH